jgi:predicted ABC-type ATPase
MKKTFRDGMDFMYELCPTNYNKIESLKNMLNEYAQYRIVGFFVGTEDVQTNIKRVTGRENKGADSVNNVKITRRYSDALSRVLELLDFVDTLYFIDNSTDDENGIRVVSKYQKHKFNMYVDNCRWFNKMIRDKILSAGG